MHKHGAGFCAEFCQSLSPADINVEIKRMYHNCTVHCYKSTHVLQYTYVYLNKQF